MEIPARSALAYAYDNVVLEALRLAQVDFRRGLLDLKHVEQMNEAIQELIADTGECEDATPALAAGKDKGSPSEESDESPSLPDLPVLRDLPPEWGTKP